MRSPASTVLLKTETTVCEVIMVHSINIKLDKKTKESYDTIEVDFAPTCVQRSNAPAYWAVVISKFNSISNQEPLKHTV